MKVGGVYKITIGNYEDRYLCIFESPIAYDLKRVQLPKSKIDAIRLPINITISKTYDPIPKSKNA